MDTQVIQNSRVREKAMGYPHGWCHWCQQTRAAIRATTEFGLHLDSTEALFREKNLAKCLKTCGGQGRT